MIRDDGPEHPLLGEDLTVGIVRVGDTGRRPRTPESDLVEPLLLYLEEVGFAGAPRFLGVDPSGRQPCPISTVRSPAGHGRTGSPTMNGSQCGPTPADLRRCGPAVRSSAVAAVTTRRYVAAVGGTVDLHRAHGHLPRERRVHQRAAAALIDFDLARPTNDNW